MISHDLAELQWMHYLLVYTSHHLLIFEHSQEILHETLIANDNVSWIDTESACGRACTGMALLLCGLCGVIGDLHFA